MLFICRIHIIVVFHIKVMLHCLGSNSGKMHIPKASSNVIQADRERTSYACCTMCTWFIF